MEFFSHIFGFNSESPLLFTQFYFWAFFAIVYAVFALIMEVGTAKGERRKARGENTRLHLRNVFLMAVSWFFYYKTSGLFLLILLFVTFSDWLIAKRIYANRADNVNQGSGKRKAQFWLALSIVIDLGLLCYFKYAYFFTNVFNNIFGTEIAVFDLFAYIGNGFSDSGRSFYTVGIIPHST